MLSVSKLVVLVAILIIVWQGFKWAGRLQRLRDSGRPRARRRQVEDLTPCPLCGVYGAAGRMRSCGRADCPYG